MTTSGEVVPQVCGRLNQTRQPLLAQIMGERSLTFQQGSNPRLPKHFLERLAETVPRSRTKSLLGLSNSPNQLGFQMAIWQGYTGVWWRWLVGLILAPLLLACLALWLDTRGLFTLWGVPFPGYWSSLSYFLTFVGAVLSGTAVYEVKSLSKRYVGRARLPALRRDLANETEVFRSKSTAPLEDLLSDGVLARLSVNLRSIRSHRTSASMKSSTAAAVSQLKRFRKSASKAVGTVMPTTQHVAGFWEAYGALEELKVEMDNYRQDEKKRQDVQ